MLVLKWTRTEEIESVLKGEHISDVMAKTREKILLRNYVGWYNSERIHSERIHQSIDYLNPNQLYTCC